MADVGPSEDLAVVKISSDPDILAARSTGRAMASSMAFSSSEQAVIATAISELARNILTYAKTGEIEIKVVARSGRRGLQVVARDKGPGIPDISQAMEDGFSTSRSLGLGLPGSKRLMDEFEIESAVGVGTTVTIVKWER